jgi:UDP-N-acetylglucosamine 1-carboxyvinyltransferase
MSRLLINGGSRLNGEVRISGSKNAILPILAATLLAEKPVIILDYPKITDVYNMLSILKHIGCRITEDKEKVVIDTSSAYLWEMPDRLAKELRSSIFMLGPVLGRFKQAKFSYPGGCEIGNRPVDLHLKGLRALNIDVKEIRGHIYCETSKLMGGEIHMDYPSVGATENIMMAAVKAQGQTVIRNAAREPEIVELERFINAMGGSVTGAGTSTIYIDGVKELKGVKYKCLPDRIVAGTYMLAAAMTRGDVTLSNTVPEHLFAVTSKLKEAGVKVDVYGDTIVVKAADRLKEMHLIETSPYPGFPTDMQAQVCAAACIAEGTSIILENVFDNRFKHVGELIRMGANITIKNNVAIIRGVEKLFGTDVTAMDLRGGAALVLAGLCAEGQTVIEQANLLDRGYEHLEDTLNALGAKVKRLEDE